VDAFCILQRYAIPKKRKQIERKNLYIYFMNYIDIVIGGLVLYGAVNGFSKGLIVEAASLIALFFGLFGALLFSSSVGKLLENYIGSDKIPPSGVLFVLTFIIIIIAINFLAKFLTRVLKTVALGGVNRVLGAVFGGLKYVLILSGIVMILDQFEFLFTFMEADVIYESTLYKPVKLIGSETLEWVLGKKDLIPKKLI
jgi:membrane protein required for colicin V production